MTEEHTSPEPENHLARTHAAAGEWAQAAEQWTLWRGQHPDDPEGYVGGAVALDHLLGAGMAKEACLKAFTAFAPAARNLSADQHWVLIRLANKLRDWDLISRLCGAARACWPDEPDLHITEAHALKQLGRHKDSFHILSLKLRAPKGDAETEKAKVWLSATSQAVSNQAYQAFAAAQARGTGPEAGPKVVLVMYAYGQPYEDTAAKLRDSFLSLCSFDCEVRLHSQETIRERPWYGHIDHCRKSPPILGRRDGTYNAWKAYIVRDALAELKDGDMVYYVDASRHFRIGFYEDINRLIRLQRDREETLFAGSFVADMPHSMGWLGDKLKLYQALGLADEYDAYLTYPARLNASFLLKKTAATMAFAEDWARHSVYETISLHHTVDQSIFSALAYKYGFYAFDIRRLPVASLTDAAPHVWGKDPNMVHRVLDSGTPWYDLFRDPRLPRPANAPLALHI